MAPRNGGVTNEAVTSARTVRRSGMSVRATSQPIGAATAQQIRLVLSGEDERGDERIEKRRIGEQRDEVAEREARRPCR